MRKILITAAAISLLTLTFAETGQARAPKVDICHVNRASDPIPTFNPTTDHRLFYPGKVISVAQTSVAAHVAHGDSAIRGENVGQYRTDTAGLASIRLSAKNNGLRFWENANCFVTRQPSP